MAQASSKLLSLRAFRIENTSLTESDSDILKFLQAVLTPESTALQRRMLLNIEDPNRDLLANFSWSKNNSYMFGMMLRIIPGDNGGVISEELFNQRTISMADVSAGSPDQSQYKDHFYFALNNDYLVTNLPGNVTIHRLQTYINWLLDGVRGENLFQFTELTKLPEGVSLSDIKSIQLVGSSEPSLFDEGSTIQIHQGIYKLTSKLLSALFGEDTKSLERLLRSQLVEAQLLIKIPKRTKRVSEEEYNRAMSAVVTNIPNNSGLVINTKDGNKYTGEAVKVKKQVSIEYISANRIVEEQLKQEMELFLSEIKAQQND